MLYSYEAGLKFSVDRLDAAIAVYDLESTTPSTGGAEMLWTRGSFWLGGVLSFARRF